MADHTAAPKMPRDAWVGEVSKRWGWVLALGILFAILGFVGLWAVFDTTLATIWLFGILLIGGSIAHVIQMFRVPSWRELGIQVLIALLYVVTAVLVFINPATAAISLTLVLAAFFLGAGVLRIIGGINARPLPGWKWVLLSGIVDVVLGGLLLSGRPSSGLWVIALFISIDLLVNGFTYIGLALQLRTTAHQSLRA